MFLFVLYSDRSCSLHFRLLRQKKFQYRFASNREQLENYLENFAAFLKYMFEKNFKVRIAFFKLKILKRYLTIRLYLLKNLNLNRNCLKTDRILCGFKKYCFVLFILIFIVKHRLYSRQHTFGQDYTVRTKVKQNKITHFKQSTNQKPNTFKRFLKRF